MGAGKQLKRILDERKMRVSDLAEETEIAPQTLYAIINRDNATIKPEILYKIAIALDMSYEEFLSRIYHSNQDDYKEKYFRGNVDFLSMTDNEVDELISTLYGNVSIYNELERENFFQSVKKIIDYLTKLSPYGRDEAVKRVEELTHIFQYQNKRLLLESPEKFNSDDSDK